MKEYCTKALHVIAILAVTQLVAQAGEQKRQLEKYTLVADDSGQVWFVNDSGEHGRSPIDFGQFIVRNVDPEKVIKLFALSHILTMSSVDVSMEQQVSDIFNLDRYQKNRLHKSLIHYFPNPDLKGVTPYFALLAAIEEAGKEIEVSYYDFIRAIIQLAQDERFMSDTSPILT